MGHNLATDIMTALLIVFGTAAITIPVTIGVVLQLQKKEAAIKARWEAAAGNIAQKAGK